MPGAGLETELGQYPKSWQLTALGQTFWHEDALLTPVSSAFGPAMLKQATEGKSLATSSSLLRWYHGSGSANILKKKRNTQLLEWIDGPALSDLINKNKDNLAIDALSDVIKKLHAPKLSDLKTTLVPLGSIMKPLLEQQYSENLIHRHGSRLIRHLLQSTEKQAPLHGDLHFDKIMHHSARGWLTISPQGITGDPHYELASALCHPSGQPNLHQVRKRIQARTWRLSKNLSLSQDRLLTFAFCHACLKTLQADHDDENTTYWHDMSTLLLDSLVL